MRTFLPWSFASLAAVIYCIVKAVIGLRARRYAWGIVGLTSAVVFLVTPELTPEANKPD